MQHYLISTLMLHYLISISMCYYVISMYLCDYLVSIPKCLYLIYTSNLFYLDFFHIDKNLLIFNCRSAMCLLSLLSDKLALNLSLLIVSNLQIITYYYYIHVSLFNVYIHTCYYVISIFMYIFKAKKKKVTPRK